MQPIRRGRSRENLAEEQRTGSRTSSTKGRGESSGSTDGGGAEVSGARPAPGRKTSLTSFAQPSSSPVQQKSQGFFTRLFGGGESEDSYIPPYQAESAGGTGTAAADATAVHASSGDSLAPGASSAASAAVDAQSVGTDGLTARADGGSAVGAGGDAAAAAAAGGASSDAVGAAGGGAGTDGRDKTGSGRTGAPAAALAPGSPAMRRANAAAGGAASSSAAGTAGATGAAGAAGNANPAAVIGGGGVDGSGATTAGVPQKRTLAHVLKKLRSKDANEFSKQYWMPDYHCRECYDCHAPFTTFRRRHHCRVCGQIYCWKCCREVIEGELFGHKGDLRVCNYCLKVVQNYSHTAHRGTVPAVMAPALAADDAQGSGAGGGGNATAAVAPGATATSAMGGDGGAAGDGAPGLGARASSIGTPGGLPTRTRTMSARNMLRNMSSRLLKIGADDDGAASPVAASSASPANRKVAGDVFSVASLSTAAGYAAAHACITDRKVCAVVPAVSRAAPL